MGRPALPRSEGAGASTGRCAALLYGRTASPLGGGRYGDQRTQTARTGARQRTRAAPGVGGGRPGARAVPRAPLRLHRPGHPGDGAGAHLRPLLDLRGARVGGSRAGRLRYAAGGGAPGHHHAGAGRQDPGAAEHVHAPGRGGVPRVAGQRQGAPVLLPRLELHAGGGDQRHPGRGRVQRGVRPQRAALGGAAGGHVDLPRLHLRQPSTGRTTSAWTTTCGTRRTISIWWPTSRRGRWRS